jgi:hypothetical protein
MGGAAEVDVSASICANCHQTLNHLVDLSAAPVDHPPVAISDAGTTGVGPTPAGRGQGVGS